MLTLLVQWHAVVERCIEDMDDANGQVAYQNEAGDLKALPQISTMKQASAEIRQLNKQLGIADGASAKGGGSGRARVIELAKSGRAERARRAM